MIPSTVAGNPTQMSHDFENKTVGIDKGSVSFILQILRNNIYSNKPAAVIREYVSNARDEMIRLNKLDEPIDITLPTNLVPEFTVRDYGRGLDKNQVFHFFGSYGTSDKRETNDLVGMMGIGCFAGFCYSNSFSITSFFNGKKFIFSNVIDSEHQDGKLVLMDESDTDEPNGVAITVPVKREHFHIFNQEVERFVKYIKYPYRIDGKLGKFYNPDFINKNWMPADESVVVMGGIPYPFNCNGVDLGRFRGGYGYETPKIVLYFDIGELEVSASREALQYTDRTKKALSARFQTIENEILKEFKDKKFKNPVEFINYFDKNSTGLVAQIIRNSIQDGKITFNGVNLMKSPNLCKVANPSPTNRPNDFIQMNSSVVSFDHMKDFSTGLNKYRYRVSSGLWFKHWIVDDLPSASGRRMRLSNYYNLEKASNILLLKFDSKQDEKDFAKLVGMPDMSFATHLSKIDPDPNFIKNVTKKGGVPQFVITPQRVRFDNITAQEEIPDKGNFYYLRGTYWKYRNHDPKIDVDSYYDLTNKSAEAWIFQYFGANKIHVIPNNAKGNKLIEKCGSRAIPLHAKIVEVWNKVVGSDKMNELVSSYRFYHNNSGFFHRFELLSDIKISKFSSDDYIKSNFKPTDQLLINAVLKNILSTYRYSSINNDGGTPEQRKVLEQLNFINFIDSSVTKYPEIMDKFKKMVKDEITKINIAILNK